MSGRIDHALVTETAARFARVLTERPDTSDVLYMLAEHVNEVLGLAGTGVSLADSDDRLHPVTGINQLTTHLEETEERLQEGPCINAFRDSAVVTARTSAELSEVWPSWSRAAEREGVQAVAGVPLRAGDLPLGSVNLYRRSDESWDASELGVAELFADMASGYIANRAELERSQQRSAQLQHALDARVVIEQAKGVLATNLNCSVDHAFTVLRDHARRTSSSLRVVAHAVVHQGFRPPHPPSAPQQ
ncbi:GAF domain-containing protein [Marmoricola sp. URHA0025 HA25]